MRAIGDMKQGLTGSRPKMSILPRAGLVYGVRPLEYGADKYARGNYHGPAPAGVAPIERALGYIDAAQRHLTRVSDAVNRALGTGGDVAAALATRDEDGGGKFPASDLPDLAHALASILIGITCAVEDGLLPADPGQPWKAALAEAGLPQKDDPAAERARVDALTRGKNHLPAEMVPALIVGGVAADLTPGDHDLAVEAFHKSRPKMHFHDDNADGNCSPCHDYECPEGYGHG